MIKCSECGEDISDKAAVCIGCGAPVITLIKCSECGIDIPEKASICNGCGAPVAAAPSKFALIGDLNGDGKVDFGDFKIAAARSKEIALSAASGAVKMGKEACHSDMAKDAAAGAVVGAAIAVPIPLIGPAFGAAIGAGVGVVKNLTKK
jgi:hypothetical protein